ncbi:MAG: HAD family hydrolase [Candidatus Dormibacteria bacterium]
MSRGVRLPDTIAACLFDLDGVLTRTAELHAAAWKTTFDEFLRRQAAPGAADPVLFDAHADYDAYVDGKPRAAGVQSFLSSRGLKLAEGSATDNVGADTVYSLGKRKAERVQDLIAQRGVRAYEGSERFLAAVREAGLLRALVTSSENADAVLIAAGLEGEFDVQVDGETAHRLGLPGKPAPDVFEEAARRLGVAPPNAAVFEDALAGVAAGRAGDFGLVVGVDRDGQADALRAAGADVVVADLAELIGAP